MSVHYLHAGDEKKENDEKKDCLDVSLNFSDKN